MADQANFQLRIIDKVTGPARKIRAALGGVQRSLIKTGAMAAQFNKVGRAAEMFGVRAGGALLSTGRALKAFSGSKFGKGLDAIGTKLAGMAKGAAIFGGAIGAFTAGALVKATAGMAAFSEQSRMAMASLTGSKAGGEDAFRRTIALSKEYGLNIQDTTKSMTKLLAAQFSLGQSEEIVKLTTDMRAIGSTAEQTDSAIRAITQIKAKGTLQMEELTGQLSETNLSADMIIGNLMKKMGKTRSGVLSAITARKVDADTAMAAIKDTILQKAHISEAGEAGKAFANETLSGMIQRLKNAPSNFTFQVSELLGTGDVKAIVSDITNLIEGISPRGAADMVKGILGMVRDGIPLLKEFAAGFGSGFQAVLDGLKAGSGDGTENLKLARDMGVAMAKGFGLALELMRKLGQAMVWANSTSGRWVVGIGLAAIAVVKVTTAVQALVGVATAAKGALAFMGVGGAASAAGGAATGGGMIAAGLTGITTGLKAIPGLVGAALPMLAKLGLVAGAGVAGFKIGETIADATGLTAWSESGHGGTQAATRGINGAVIRPGSMGATPTARGRVRQDLVGGVRQPSGVQLTVNTKVDASGATDPNAIGKQVAAHTANVVANTGASLAYGG